MHSVYGVIENRANASTWMRWSQRGHTAREILVSTSPSRRSQSPFWRDRAGTATFQTPPWKWASLPIPPLTGSLPGRRRSVPPRHIVRIIALARIRANGKADSER